MAKCFSVNSILEVTFYLFLLSVSVRCVSSARILDEDADIVDTPTFPVVTPATSIPVTTPADGVDPAVVVATGPVENDDHTHPPTLTFFVHAIVSGSAPSTRTVTGIAANSQLPFAKSNGGAPLLNGNTGISSNNNVPFVAGLGNTNTLVQNNGNSNTLNTGNRVPFVTGGQVPAGSTLQQPMFGSITVIDYELTEGQELGLSVVGKAQGFCLASSQDGSSQTMALTALFHGADGINDHDFDTMNFFGIHKTAAPVSHIAVIGGTGKYENSKGYATIEPLHEVDQHTTDGAETVLKISVYLTP